MPGTAVQRAYRIITVTITPVPGTGPIVDPDPSAVSKQRKDEIVWRCDEDPNWKVDYGEESPFGRTTFDRDHDCSGPARAGARERIPYKYSVTAGGGTTDPGTIVNQ